MAAEISPRRVEDDSILVAARRLILARGVGRVTITDVAREANVSRMTVYRRWSSFAALLGSLLQQEWDRLLSARLDPGLLAELDPEAFATRAAEQGGTRSFLVGQVVTATATIRDSDLLQALLRHDPEFLLPYLVERPGTIHRFARELFGVAIAAGQVDGTVREGDPDTMAAAVVVAAQGFVVSTASAGADLDPADLDRELGAIVDGYLATRR